MRKILFPAVVLLMLFVSSCKKQSIGRLTRTQPDETMNIRVGADQLYSLDLSNAGIVKIIKQASNFSLSETVTNTVRGGFNYNYIPAKGFTGKDQVVLLSTMTVMNAFPLNVGGGICNEGNNNSVSVISKNIVVKIQVGN